MLNVNLFAGAPEAYTFDDLQLVPNYSTVKSRKDPDTTTKRGTIKYSTPLIASPMNTVCEADMVATMKNLGGAGVLHRYMSIQEQARQIRFLCKDDDIGVWAAVGANGDSQERVNALLEAGIMNFCIDIANGHSEHCVQAIRYIKSMHSGALVMAGNVCSYDGALRLADVGADAIRVGIGPGSVCTTRLVTGHGVPQLTAIDQCSRVHNVHSDVFVIADGGIRSSGDCVKALAAGADACMVGSLLAGTSDTPGDIIHENDGTQWKYYSGMASEAARDRWFDREQTSYVPEGASTRVPYRGSTSETVERILGGIRVGMSYSGAHNLEELREKAQWVRVTGAGLMEATPHKLG